MGETTANDAPAHFAKCAHADCGRTLFVSLQHCPHCGRAQPATAPAAGEPAAGGAAVPAPDVGDSIDKRPADQAATGEDLALRAPVVAGKTRASAQLDVSAALWIGASVLALAAGFLFVRPHSALAPATSPGAAPVAAPVAAPSPPTASVPVLTPQARASQMLQQVKLNTTPTVAFADQSDVRAYLAPATVAISALYADAQQGDHMDVTLYSGDQVTSRCNTYYLIALPSGAAWCQMPGIGPGNYSFHLLLNDVEVGTYTFSVAGDTAATANAPPPSGDAASTSRQQIVQYFADWSAVNNSGVQGLRRYYADMVNFYGSSLTADAVMAQKLRFAARWPVRTYVMRPDTVSTNCADDGSCTVSGVLDWDASNPQTGKRSIGVAQFTFSLRNGLIADEGGNVVSRQ